MARCSYCRDPVGLWSKICKDCKRLLARVNELRGRASYGEFLDELERTGIPKEKIMVFLKADPDGQGSIQDQVTAEMASELMKVMGLKGSQTARDVRKIRNIVGKGSKPDK